MEKLQGPIIHPCLLEEHLELGCIDHQNGGGFGISCGQFYSIPSLEDKMPFLQMLQCTDPPPPLLPPPPPLPAETAAFPFLQEPNFQLLLRLQQEKIMELTNNDEIMIMEELQHSPVKSEITYRETTQRQLPTPPLMAGSFSPATQRKKGGGFKMSGSVDGGGCDGGGGGGGKERRKRKRAARPSKNKEQVESQRMTHIAVERNRRRQMNDHLNALRSLMPPSYVQRGDQASIIGGAIDFVKELEQLLHSLQAQKRLRQHHNDDQNGDVSATSTTTTSTTTCSSSNLFSTLHFANPSNSRLDELEPGGGFVEYARVNHDRELCAENRSSLGDIEVVVIQNHVNLKVQCHRRPGQLLKAIVALEDIRLSVLHLNITSFHTLVLYSFNLKIEDDCKLGSANEVASAVHQIFSLINIT